MDDIYDPVYDRINFILLISIQKLICGCVFNIFQRSTTFPDFMMMMRKLLENILRKMNSILSSSRVICRLIWRWLKASKTS
ncbi:hypothetical protein CS542_06255 [Pedobacter sp. IW39]|nr:hypothetical protein CS542_06255 [Pedobacter sp. IW39]